VPSELEPILCAAGDAEDSMTIITPVRTDEEKMRRALDELQLQQNQRINPLMYYNPLPWQKRHHRLGHPKSTRATFGGNQIGKTVSGAAEMAIHMSQMYPEWWPMECRRDGLDGRPGPPLIAIQVGPDFDNWLEQVYLPKFQSFIPQGMAKAIKSQGKIRGYTFDYRDSKPPHGINPHHKNVVHFMTYTQDLFAFEGKTIDIAGFDEPPPFGIWTATKRGLMARDGIAYFTLTPLTEPWLDAELNEKDGIDPDVHCMTVEIWENCVENGGYLRRDQIESFLESIPDEERLAREKGIFRHLAGVVYPELGPIHQVEDHPVPSDWSWYEAIDPHGARPTCMAFAAVDREGRVTFVDQLVLDGSAQEIFAATQEIRAKHGGRTPVWTVADRKMAQAEQRVGSKKTSWEKELRLAGFKNLVFSDSSPGSVGAGVRVVREYLKPVYDTFLQEEIPRVRFFKKACTATKKDRRGAEYGIWFQMRRVQWDDMQRKSIHEKAAVEKMKDVNKDLPDCCRYLLERRPRWVDPNRMYAAQEAENSQPDRNTRGGGY